MIQAVALLSVFGLGIAFSVLGALKLELVKSLSIDDAQFGKLISALMFTSIFVVLIFGPLVDMFGYKPVAILGFVLGFIAVVLLVTTRSYGVALVSCVLLGIGAMCMNLGNTLIPMVLFTGNPVAASNFGNVFFGLGAFIAPFLIAMFLKNIGYRNAGLAVAFIMLLPVVTAVSATFPPVQQTGMTLAGAFAAQFGLLANPAVIVAALALFCYIALEVSMGGWITTYTVDQGFDEKSSGIILSLFWIGLMVARLITATLITAGNGAIAIALLAAVAFLSIGIMSATSSKALGGGAVIVTGLAFGPIFPTVVGVTFAKIDPTLYGSAFGIIFAVGLLGGSTLPAAMGSLAKGKSIKKSLPLAMTAAAVLCVIALILGRV